MESKIKFYNLSYDSSFSEGITNFLKNNIILKALLIIILSLLFANCSHSRQKFYTNPNSYIIDQLANKRIIMLGDFMHTSPVSYGSLMSLLNEWIIKIKNGESKNYNVVLILEADTQEVSNLKQFLSTGKWKPLLDYWLPYNSLEWLEFCSNLRTLEIEIKQLNQSKDFPKINLNIYGGEGGSIFDSPEFLKYSESEGSKFFVNKRDSITAHNIINYFKRHKNTKAIIFYGNLHLIKNFVNKNLLNALPDTEASGYYLAHYLKKEFGDRQVLSINQYEVAQQTINSSPFFAPNTSEILVYSQYIPWKHIHPDNYDAFILRHDNTEMRGHSLGSIFSNNVIYADIKKMQFFKRYFPGYLAKGYYNIAQQSLQLITGKNFNTLSKWRKWLRNKNYDGIKRLNSKTCESDMYSLYCNNFNDRQIKVELYLLGVGPEIASRHLLSKSQWDKLWKNSLTKIKFLNEIGIDWVGTKKEKEEAQKYLVHFVNIAEYTENTEPKEYLKLYRRVFENVK